jgi:hypothetical protein
MITSTWHWDGKRIRGITADSLFIAFFLLLREFVEDGADCGMP